jgi:uncharacterized membrane protein
MFAPADSYVPQCGARARSVRGPVFVWAILAAVALAIVGLIVAAPLLVAHGHTSLAAAIYEVFGKLCHQIPERSLHLEGHKFAVCSRCTGIYAGFALSVLCYPLARSLKRVDTPRLLWLLLAVVPITVDWSLGFFDVWANTHLSRFLTGALLGSVAAVYVVPGLIDLCQEIWRRAHARSTRPSRPAAAAKTTRAVSLPSSAPSDYGSPSSRI